MLRHYVIAAFEFLSNDTSRRLILRHFDLLIVKGNSRPISDGFESGFEFFFELKSETC